MTEHGEDALSLVQRIVAQELGMAILDVTPQLGLYGHPRWDSIAHANILIRLEIEGGLILTDLAPEYLTTVEQMANSIKGSK